jgi:thiol-disulfide isomerase/thioredoxin
MSDSPKTCGARYAGVVLLAAALVGAGCASLRHLQPPPADARHHVISLRDVSNGDVLVRAAAALEDEAGVHRADADLVHAEINVWTRAEVEPGPLVHKLAEHRLDAVPAAGQGSYRPPPGYAPSCDARILTSTGEDVEDLSVHAVAGKVTVFDFYADWCGPCRLLDKQLRAIAAVRTDVAVRKLNIVDFNSLLAARWVHNAIPLLMVYDRGGKKIAEIRGANPQAIVVAIGKATRSKD